MTKQERFQTGEFAELVGLSIPQLRRYDRLQLLAPKERSASGYRYYGSGQTGAGRVIALLRSMDMPIAEIRRVLQGLDDDERKQLFSDHKARLEERLEEAQSLLNAVDQLANGDTHTMKDTLAMTTPTELSTWLHYMPHLPVTDIDKSVAYYEETMGFRLAWQTTDRKLTALASGHVELLLLVPWSGGGDPQPQSAYVYVENPDGLCAEYEQAGAIIVEPVATRPYGMRDFCVEDPDGHRFVLGRAGESLRYSADHYGMERDEIVVNPDWVGFRTQDAD